MSSLSNDALARLGGALALSAGLHASAVVGLGALPWAQPGAAGDALARRAQPINVALRPEPAPAQPKPSAPREPATRYFMASELDARPSPQGEIDPAYPNDAFLRDITGAVLVRLYISESGAVEKAVIVRAEPPGYFEEAVQRAFLAARFTPGMKQGRAVKTQMVIEVRYESPRPVPSPKQ